MPALAAFLSLFLLSAPPAGGQTPTATGTIVDVELRLPLGMAEKDIMYYIEARPGTAFSPETVADDITRLRLTEKFRDVQAQVSPEVLPTGERGVKVVYVLVPKTLIKEILIKGNRALSRDDLLTAMGLRVGAEFPGAPPSAAAGEPPSPALKEDLAKWTLGAKGAYRRAGYPRAEVSFRTEGVDSGVRLIVSVSENVPVTVADIDFQGDIFTTADVLRGVIPLKSGQVAAESVIDRSVSALKDYYRSEGFWGVQVDRPLVTLLEQGAAARVVFPVRAGDRYRVTFSGNRHFSDKTLMRSIDIEGGVAVDYWAEQMEKSYRDSGYFYARVRPTVTADAAKREKDVVFSIDEGGRIRLTRISFQGNETLSSEELLKHMTTRTYVWFWGGIRDFIANEKNNGIYTEERFRDDLAAVISLYQTRGRLDAKIEDVKVDVDKAAGTMAVTVFIDEGPLTILRDIRLEGVRSLPETEVLEALPLKPGSPLNLLAVEIGNRAVVSLYRSRGYFYVKSEARVDIGKGEEGAQVVYTVREGDRLTVGRIIVQGTDKTKDYVITREVPAHTGDPYTRDLLLTAQQRLARLGYFNRVTITPIARGTVRDILIRVEEGDTGKVALGIGYGNVDGLRGFAEVSETNITGRGRQVSLRLDGAEDIIRYAKGEDSFSGSANEAKATLGYREPYLFRTQAHGRIDLIRQYQNRRYVGFAIRRNSVVVGADYNFTDRLKGVALYEFEVRRLEGSNIPPDQTSLLQLGTLSPVLVYDLRDSAFNPRRGQVLSFQTDWSELLFGSKQSFLKATGKWGYYNPMVDGIIGAVVVRAGYAVPYRGAASLPLEKRFYTGGANSIRGFVEDNVGPRLIVQDTSGRVLTDAVVGGDILLNLTLEARIPMYGKLGLAVFTDWGNVWSDPDHFSLGSFADVRKSAGLGLRYQTPIGPLRIDMGFKLDRQGNEPLVGFHFFIGNVF